MSHASGAQWSAIRQKQPPGRAVMLTQSSSSRCKGTTWISLASLSARALLPAAIILRDIKSNGPPEISQIWTRSHLTPKLFLQNSRSERHWGQS